MRGSLGKMGRNAVVVCPKVSIRGDTGVKKLVVGIGKYRIGEPVNTYPIGSRQELSVGRVIAGAKCEKGHGGVRVKGRIEGEDINRGKRASVELKAAGDVSR